MGSELDSFETNQIFNDENFVSMRIETDKTCYYGGEFINGKITLKPNDGLSNPLLSDPSAKLTITENFHYQYTQQEYVGDKKEKVKKIAEEVITFVDMPMNFTDFQNANIKETVVIPFRVQIPMNVYPSVLIDPQTFVKHYLCIDFPSIQAKKTVIIVIKNRQYFTTYNGLLKEPAECSIKIDKGVVISGGSFTATLTLPKNHFFYDEMIPFTLDLDCNKLSLNIKGIKVTIERKFQKNYQHDHNQHRDESSKEISEKKIPLIMGKKEYHVQDFIQLTEQNPKPLYDKLDADNRRYSQKYADIHIYPTCYGGLISCEYHIKILIIFNSVFYTNETISMPIDLHCPYSLQHEQNPPQVPPEYPPQVPPEYPPQVPQEYPPQNIPPSPNPLPQIIPPSYIPPSV